MFFKDQPPFFLNLWMWKTPSFRWKQKAPFWGGFVVPLGLEPRTTWLWVRCSNQLSYRTCFLSDGKDTIFYHSSTPFLCLLALLFALQYAGYINFRADPGCQIFYLYPLLFQCVSVPWWLLCCFPMFQSRWLHNTACQWRLVSLYRRPMASFSSQLTIEMLFEGIKHISPLRWWALLCFKQWKYRHFHRSQCRM